MNHTLRVLLMVLILVVPLALVGCGGGSSGGSSSGGNGDNGQVDNGGGQDGDAENGNDNDDEDANDEDENGDNGDAPEQLSGALDPVQTLSGFLLEDILAEGLLRDLDTGTGVEDDLADGTVCISQGIDALLEAPETLLAAFLGDFQHQQNVADLDDAATDAGQQLDLATNRLVDGLLLSLGGSGTCGSMVGAPDDLNELGLDGLDELLALARGGLFSEVTSIDELQGLLVELSVLTSDLRNEIAANDELAELYRNLIGVTDTTVVNTITVVELINANGSFDQVLTATGILVQDLLDGVLNDVLGLGGDLDGILDTDGLVALEEVQAILDNIVTAVSSGDPDQIVETLTGSLEGIVANLLGGDALDLIDAGLLDGVLDGGPLGDVLSDLLDADVGLLGGLLGLVDGLLGDLLDDLLGGLLGG